MFATHPMSEERYQTAVKTVSTGVCKLQGPAAVRERYMDNTARLRSIKDAIEEMQKGDKALAPRTTARPKTITAALRQAPTTTRASLDGQVPVNPKNTARGRGMPGRRRSSIPRRPRAIS